MAVRMTLEEKVASADSTDHQNFTRRFNFAGIRSMSEPFAKRDGRRLGVIFEIDINKRTGGKRAVYNFLILFFRVAGAWHLTFPLTIGRPTTSYPISGHILKYYHILWRRKIILEFSLVPCYKRSTKPLVCQR